MSAASRKRQTRIVHLLTYFVLSIITLILIFPYLWMVDTSLMTMAQITNQWPPNWIPDPIAWENYPTALVRWMPFPLLFRNTIFIAESVIVGSLLSCSLVAYGFAHLRFPGRDVLFVVLLSTMMVPFVVTLVPLFLLYTRLGWINTFYPLIVPFFFGYPFFIFLIRQFYMGIPRDLIEAARIDGASEIGIWWNIMLPLSRPVLMTVGIFAFQHVWNDFMGPLVFLQKTEVKTVMLGIYNLAGQIPRWNYVMAAVVTTITPAIVLFFAFQKYFVRGISLTGTRR